MYKKLVLWDWDETIALPQKLAYTSLGTAAKSVVPANYHGELINEHVWRELLMETKGTAEYNLARSLALKAGVSEGEISRFVAHFCEARANFLRESKVRGEFVYDHLYADAVCLLLKLDSQAKTLQMLATGNPREVMKERIHPLIRPLFEDGRGRLRGVFGDDEWLPLSETNSKGLMLRKAVLLAQRDHGFIGPTQAAFSPDVFFIADSERDLAGGMLSAQVRTVLVPRHDITGYEAECEVQRMLQKLPLGVPFSVPQGEELRRIRHGFVYSPEGGGLVRVHDPCYLPMATLINPICSQYLGVDITPMFKGEWEVHFAARLLELRQKAEGRLNQEKETSGHSKERLDY